MEFDLANIMITGAIGLAGGLLGGLLGIGGSIVVIPLLGFAYGPNQQLYQATAMIMNVVVGASATLKHHLKGAIQLRLVARLIPAALVGILGGVALSNTIPPLPLQLLFALFLVYIGLREAWTAYGPGRRDEPREGRESTGRIAGVGGFTGLLAGLLGIGGGIVIIPLLKRFCRMDMKQAIPASSATMLVTATVGATYKNLTLPELMAPDGTPLRIAESLGLAAAMIPTAFLGSYVGAGLMHRLPMGLIKKVFALLILLAAARMASSAWTQMEAASAAVTPPTVPAAVTR